MRTFLAVSYMLYGSAWVDSSVQERTPLRMLVTTQQQACMGVSGCMHVKQPKVRANSICVFHWPAWTAGRCLLLLPLVPIWQVVPAVAPVLLS
jgi:hypothetical protein